MCSGASSRISQGGTVAILHPTPPAVNAVWPSFPWQTHTFKGELFFQNGEVAEGTRAIFRSSYGNSHKDLEDCTVLIHEDGDLLNPAVARPPLHHLDISGTSRRSSYDSSAEWELGEALDLGVGGTGIIGRRITVHRAAGRGLTGPIAEGIIGWN